MEKCSLPSLSIFLFATLPSCRAWNCQARTGVTGLGGLGGWVDGWWGGRHSESPFPSSAFRFSFNKHHS